MCEKKNRKRNNLGILPVNHLVALGFLLTLWFKPEIVSLEVLDFIVALLGGLMLAQIFIMIIEYVLIRYGANRQGVIFLSTIVGLLGLAIAYYAWQERNYAMLNIAWIIIYTCLAMATAAAKRKLGSVLRDMFLYVEYLFVALFAAALFQAYISQSSLAEYDLVYSGVEGETVWFVAMVILICSITYEMYLKIKKQSTKLVSTLSKR